MSFYERWLGRLKISDEAIALFPNKEKLVGHSLFWTAVAILGLPIALYGWAQHLGVHVHVGFFTAGA